MSLESQLSELPDSPGTYLFRDQQLQQLQKSMIFYVCYSLEPVTPTATTQERKWLVTVMSK